MTSIGPYSQSLNFTHMFNFRDLRGCYPKEVLEPNSISGIISRHPETKKFSYILNLSNLQGIYNDCQANFTVFVPSDIAIKNLPEGVFTNMDLSTARHIVLTSSLNNRITTDILQDSPASYLYTRDPPNRLYVTNISGKTLINNSINVLNGNINATNGIIHIIDSLIWPEII